MKTKFHLPKKKCVTRLSKRKVARGSYRWIARGKGKRRVYLLIGCPRGKWKKDRCVVGTFAVEKVKAAPKRRSCPR